MRPHAPGVFYALKIGVSSRLNHHVQIYRRWKKIISKILLHRPQAIFILQLHQERETETAARVSRLWFAHIQPKPIIHECSNILMPSTRFSLTLYRRESIEYRNDSSKTGWIGLTLLTRKTFSLILERNAGVLKGPVRAWFLCSDEALPPNSPKVVPLDGVDFQWYLPIWRWSAIFVWAAAAATSEFTRSLQETICGKRWMEIKAITYILLKKQKPSTPVAFPANSSNREA